MYTTYLYKFISDLLPGMLTGMTGMFVMTGYRQASIWNAGMVLKWAWMKLTVYFHLARLETGSLLSCARKDATGPNCGNQRLGGGLVDFHSSITIFLSNIISVSLHLTWGSGNPLNRIRLKQGQQEVSTMQSCSNLHDIHAFSTSTISVYIEAEC